MLVFLAELVNRPPWHADAAYRGLDPALFFPERGDGRPVAALAYCEDCSNRSQCLAAALEAPSSTGEWGRHDGTRAAGAAAWGGWRTGPAGPHGGRAYTPPPQKTSVRGAALGGGRTR